MRADEYAAHDGLGLAELVRRQQVRPAELAELALDGVSRLNPLIGAVVETFSDRVADAERIAADARSSGGPFPGVPFLLKDLGCTEAGRRCEAGSRLFAGRVASADSELMRRFRAAGLVTLGRTVTAELGETATAETLLYGAARNPYDLRRSTAGSSGGSAAAVAAGIVPLAHGSDGGGSIRMPASCCGLVGLKPTRGRISRAPAGVFLGDFAVDFALTRSIRDTAALLDAVQGPAPGDPYRIPPPAGRYADRLGAPARLKVAVTTRHFWGRSVDPEVARAVERTAQTLSEMGHTVVEAHPELDAEPYLRATLDLWAAQTVAEVDQGAAAMGRAPGRDTLEGYTLALVERGRRLTATEIVAALDTLEGICRRVAPLFEAHDVLLSATLPSLPLPLGLYEPARPVTLGWYFDSPVGELESVTSLFNCTGQPAISLPLHVSAAGLPIGIHLAARFGDEASLLVLGAQLEEALPWRDRRPPTHLASAGAGAPTTG
ncbi:MAG TPA: amidase [Verrucomicrobiae bacterium]|nr:amidase [Verrucomicrobiae bacterium]